MEKKVWKKKVWRKIRDDEVHHLWICKNENCLRSSIRVTIHPAFYEDRGTPLCSICGLMLDYVHTEVLS